MLTDKNHQMDYWHRYLGSSYSWHRRANIHFGTNALYGFMLDNNFLCLLSCIAGLVILGLLFYIRKLFARPQCQDFDPICP